VRNTGTTQQENDQIERTKLSQAQQLCRAEQSPSNAGFDTCILFEFK
jgi:hypothetical protein